MCNEGRSHHSEYAYNHMYNKQHETAYYNKKYQIIALFAK